MLQPDSIMPVWRFREMLGIKDEKLAQKQVEILHNCLERQGSTLQQPPLVVQRTKCFNLWHFVLMTHDEG